MKKYYTICAFFIFCILFFSCSINHQLSSADKELPHLKKELSYLQEELSYLQEEFSNIMPYHVTLGKKYEAKIRNQILQIFYKMVRQLKIFSNECFIFVDANPNAQIIFVGIFDFENNKIHRIGIDRVSTGNSKRAGYWLTPSGVYENTLRNIGWRALGTKNDKGWRGLGKKGSRVWDFGWQFTKETQNSKISERKIRLVLHATDPEFGTKRLGQVDSMGCVRISAEMNYFLDHYGIIDREYEKNKNNKKVSWLLKKNRLPTPLAGKYLIIQDSSNF